MGDSFCLSSRQDWTFPSLGPLNSPPSKPPASVLGKGKGKWEKIWAKGKRLPLKPSLATAAAKGKKGDWGPVDKALRDPPAPISSN